MFKDTLPARDANFNRIYRDYRRNAMRRGVEFNLTKEELNFLTSLDCSYCGTPPRETTSKDLTRSGGDSRNFNGVDRVDNSIGYSLENCVTCCKICNYMKWKLTLTGFLDHVKKIHNHTTKGTK